MQSNMLLRDSPLLWMVSSARKNGIKIKMKNDNDMRSSGNGERPVACEEQTMDIQDICLIHEVCSYCGVV
jgi:hypothetical protein